MLSTSMPRETLSSCPPIQICVYRAWEQCFQFLSKIWYEVESELNGRVAGLFFYHYIHKLPQFYSNKTANRETTFDCISIGGTTSNNRITRSYLPEQTLA
jgi:hypothetical protein